VLPAAVGAKLPDSVAEKIVSVADAMMDGEGNVSSDRDDDDSGICAGAVAEAMGNESVEPVSGAVVGPAALVDGAGLLELGSAIGTGALVNVSELVHVVSTAGALTSSTL
jgi:hypothetical protein